MHVVLHLRSGFLQKFATCSGNRTPRICGGRKPQRVQQSIRHLAAICLGRGVGGGFGLSFILKEGKHGVPACGINEALEQSQRLAAVLLFDIDILVAAQPDGLLQQLHHP